MKHRPRTWEKTELIAIRCTPETKRRWRLFLAEEGLRNSEEGLRLLLSLWERQRRRPVALRG